MANNSAAYAYFIGFRFTDLSFGEAIEARKGLRVGYLQIEPVTGIIRSAG